MAPTSEIPDPWRRSVRRSGGAAGSNTCPTLPGRSRSARSAGSADDRSQRRAPDGRGFPPAVAHRAGTEISPCRMAGTKVRDACQAAQRHGKLWIFKGGNLVRSNR